MRWRRNRRIKKWIRKKGNRLNKWINKFTYSTLLDVCVSYALCKYMHTVTDMYEVSDSFPLWATAYLPFENMVTNLIIEKVDKKRYGMNLSTTAELGFI